VLRLRYQWSIVAGPPRISHLEVWLDPASYLPSRIQYQDRATPGRVIVRGDVRYTYERVNAPVPPGAFAVPAGAKISAAGRFRSMPLGRARALASYQAPRLGRPPRPGWRLLRAGISSSTVGRGRPVTSSTIPATRSPGADLGAIRLEASKPNSSASATARSNGSP